MSRAEVEALSAALDIRDRALMVGVLASSKTLAGITNKYPNRFPRVDAISSVFEASRRLERSLNLVHYSTDNPTDLGEELSELAGRCAFCDGWLGIPNVPGPERMRF